MFYCDSLVGRADGAELDVRVDDSGVAKGEGLG